jgi:SHS2 domain-containing protein
VTTASHAFAEHTSELEIRVAASSLPALFTEAGRALAEVMAGKLPPASGPAQAVSVHASDRDALLVAWLDELLFLADRDKRVYGDIAIERMSERDLLATVRGATAARLRTQVKAATFHGLRILDGPGGVSATVILDV